LILIDILSEFGPVFGYAQPKRLVLLLRAEGGQKSAFFRELVVFGSVAHVAILCWRFPIFYDFYNIAISKSRLVAPAAVAEPALELLLDPAHLFARLPG
jgi:hypothetical protein